VWLQMKGKRVHATDEEKAAFIRAVLAGKDPLAFEKEREKEELKVCLQVSSGVQFCTFAGFGRGEEAQTRATESEQAHFSHASGRGGHCCSRLSQRNERCRCWLDNRHCCCFHSCISDRSEGSERSEGSKGSKGSEGPGSQSI